jgi:tetratricopeptide (TPR) repeat protein
MPKPVTARRRNASVGLLGMRLLVWSGAIAALCIPSLPRAQILNEISVQRVGDVAEIEVFFNLRVRYLRHFPLDHGKTLRVFVALIPVDGVIPQVVQDFRTSPPNKGIPPFTVLFPDQGALRIQFATPVHFKVGPGSDARSIRIRVILPPPKPAPAKSAGELARPSAGIELGTPGAIKPVPPTPAPPADTRVAPPVDAAAASSSELDVEAGKLMAQARAAIDAGDNATAIDALNRLLNLPPNRFSQEAQELAGVARQLYGEIAKARAEYELYLKLYPDSEGAVRVRDRLAGLGAVPAEGERAPEPLGTGLSTERETETMFYGTLSQYYYSGASKIDTTSKPPQQFSTQSLSFTDQSALISSLDVTGRMRRDHSDTRVVVRDTYNTDFIRDGNDLNRLYAAYLEHDQKDWGLLLRAGRQAPPTGGIAERFDGGYLRQSLGSLVRVFALGGMPKDFLIDSQRHFYQAGLEFGRVGAQWGITLYGFNQTIDDIADRNIVGGEARFFSNGSSIYSLVDYDILFDDINILLTQGNWQGAHGTSINLIVDHRKTPTLQTANALTGEPATSIRELLDSGLTPDMLRERAAAVTADATLFLVGLTQTVNGHWQLGGDLRTNRISATQGSGMMPPTEDTGTVYSYSVQATATAIFGNSDVNVLSVGLIDAADYQGTLVLLSNSTTWNNWRFEPALRYYEQTDDLGGSLTRLNPNVRLTYRFRDSVSFEAEAGYEQSNTDTMFATDETRREYFSLGYRWNFN